MVCDVYSESILFSLLKNCEKLKTNEISHHLWQKLVRKIASDLIHKLILSLVIASLENPCRILR